MPRPRESLRRRNHTSDPLVKLAEAALVRHTFTPSIPRPTHQRRVPQTSRKGEPYPSAFDKLDAKNQPLQGPAKADAEGSYYGLGVLCVHALLF